MNTGILNKYLNGKNIATGNAKAIYTFSGSSAESGIVFNDLYDRPSHLVYDNPTSTWYRACGLYSCLSLGHDGALEGIFHQDPPTLLKISDPINFNSWTIFLDISTTGIETTGNLHKIGDVGQQSTKNKAKTLVSSMYAPESGLGDNDSIPSGFNIGINGANKLYLEYFSYENKKYIETFSQNIQDRGIVSVSMNHGSNNLSFSKFQPNESYQEPHSIQHSRPSSDWYIGGFRTGTYEIKDEDINFSGMINNAVLFSPALTQEEEKDFSDYFFIDDYSPGEYKKRAIGTTKKRKNPVLVSGIVGTGITGYEASFSQTVTNLDGTTVSTYCGIGYGEPLTGAISGTMVEYEEVDEDVTIYETYLASETKDYNINTFSPYGDKKIRFVKSLESGYGESLSGIIPSGGHIYPDNTLGTQLGRHSLDGYEIYTSKDLNKKLNLIPNYRSQSGLFTLNNYDGEYINLYRNGILQKSGSQSDVDLTTIQWQLKYGQTGQPDYAVIDVNKIWSNYKYNKYDFVVYETSEQPPFVSGFTKIYGGGYHSSLVNTTNDGKISYLKLADNNLTGRDIYFGGLKLISGIDYEYDAPPGNIIVRTEFLDKGDFSIIEQPQVQWIGGNLQDGYRITGKISGTIETDIPLIDEIVWVSGIRQQRTYDFLKTEKSTLLGEEKYTFNSGVNPNTILSGSNTGFYNTWYNSVNHGKVY